MRFALCSLFIVGAGMPSWCLAADEEKPTVVVSLSQLNDEVHVLRNKLSNTMAALQALKDACSNGGDLTKTYSSFSDAFTALDAQATKIREHGTAAKARAKERWEVWQKELTAMQNPKLREKAQSRYTATQKEFDKIVERVDTAKEVFAPLMADLKDITVYLKTDLSSDSVSSLSGTIWKMGSAARGVDSKLEDVNDQIDKTLKKMPKM